MESISSSPSSNANANAACNSVNASGCCSSNRTHIKRPRFHIIKKSGHDEVQCDYIPNPMFDACHANRDAFIKLLLSACDGTDNTMGSPDMPEIFWDKFTKRWVQDLKLDIVITQETVATCQAFGTSLEDLYLEMEKTSRAIEKHRREQLCQPLHLKQSLFKVFGTCKPHSTGSSSSSKSSRSSKSIDASRLSDARGPIDVYDDWNEWEPRLTDALAALHSANLVTVAEVELVSAQFRRCTTRVGLRIFLGKHLPADQVQIIRDMLANPHVV